MSHVRKHGPGKWQARWTDPAKRQRSKVFTKKSDAEKFLTAMDNARFMGAYVDPRAGKTTVGEMADMWLPTKLSVAPTTHAIYESILRTYIYPRWGTTPLGNVDHAD